MMCGLQGSGKTTTTGKLARLLQKQGRKPLLVACDLQRPAAIEQLHVLGEQIGVPVYDRARTPTRSTVAERGVREARQARGATSSSSTPPAGCTSTTS